MDERVEILCTFLEFNGLSVRRCSSAEAMNELSLVHAMVVCRVFLRLSSFHRLLAEAKKTKTRLAYVWSVNEAPNRVNVVDKEHFDKLIYENEQLNLS